MSLPSYVINWDELEGLFESLSDGLVARGISDVSGIQKVKGFAESLPAIQAQYKAVSWVLPYNIVLTAVTVNQSAWKGEDYWEFWVDDERLFETVYTKELGEQKHWEVVQPVREGSIIEIILHNNSGNSRNIWSDIEYLEVGDFEEVEEEEDNGIPNGEIIPTPEPEEPEVEYEANVTVRYLDDVGGQEIRPNKYYYSQTGIVDFTGDEIDGWILLEPKTQTIEITSFDDSYIDFYYKKEPPSVPPNVPPVDHLYDWMAVLRWESGVETDLDFYAEYGDKVILYSNRSDVDYDGDGEPIQGIWLDHDYIEHSGSNDREEKPEIITILGNFTEKIKLSVRPYSGADELTEKVTVEIFRFQEDGAQKSLALIEKEALEFKDKDIFERIDIATINLDTEEITVH